MSTKTETFISTLKKLLPTNSSPPLWKAGVKTIIQQNNTFNNSETTKSIKARICYKSILTSIVKIFKKVLEKVLTVS